MTEEQFRKYALANFEGITTELNKLRAEMLAYRSLSVALASLHRLNPTDGARRPEMIRDIALGNFSSPIDGRARTPYDEHAVATVKETFAMIDQAAVAIMQSGKPN